MSRTAANPLSGDVLTLTACESDDEDADAAGRTFVLEVRDEAASDVLRASVPVLDRLLVEKTAEVREQRMEEMVDFLTAQLLAPSPFDAEMAQRLAMRHARILNEFGFYTAEKLARANRSQAADPAALADNWRKRRRIFAVPHPRKKPRSRDVYPAFQFEDHQPIKAVQEVLEAFGEHKRPWKIALWFTSNNGWLPDSARPVDLLVSDAQAVIDAARRDAGGSAA